MTTVTKKELMELGYGPSFSSDIIRMAKHFMVNEGFSYYSSRRLGRVPVHAIEHVLGFNPLSQLNNTLLQNEEVSQ